MLERYVQLLRTDDPGSEEPAATRERLKAHFPPGSVRRMTQLGLLVGAALHDLAPDADDTVIYASSFGESRALEAYLDSFPEASPTLFQTSIHPSGVQQGLIARRRSLRELVPLSGDTQLPVQALLAAALSPSPRTLICGGEEFGPWLASHGISSPRTFAFAVALTADPGPQPLARLTLTPSADTRGHLSLSAWFDLLHHRRPFEAPAAEGWSLTLSWL
jgi:hypothetical protein